MTFFCLFLFFGKRAYGGSDDVVVLLFCNAIASNGIVRSRERKKRGKKKKKTRGKKVEGAKKDELHTL